MRRVSHTRPPARLASYLDNTPEDLPPFAVAAVSPRHSGVAPQACHFALAHLPPPQPLAITSAEDTTPTPTTRITMH